MKLRIAAVALVALTLLAGCNKGASNNANGTTVNGNSNVKPAGDPVVTTTPLTTTPLGTPTTTASAATPTEAFQLYLEAVKRNDAPAVKSLFSRATLKMLEERAEKSKKSFDDVFNEGFEDAKRDAQSSTYETSNEKINGDRATLDVKDSKRGKPITLNFVREGGWKLSFVDEGGDDAGGDEGGH